MQSRQLAEIFKMRYHSAEKGMAVASIHLFGIEFAEQLQGQALKEICEMADVPVSYVTELHKGMRLSPFVTLKK